MNYKIIVLYIIGLFSAIYADAQVILVPLESNATIENHLKLNSEKASFIRTNDTITLPFFDDFSKTDIFPDNSKWTDNDVFINQTFGDNPPSIGVATFDALDSSGQLQSNASSLGFISDFLTSKSINLYDYTEKNPISISTTLLFYYETLTGIYRPSDSLYYKISGIPYNCVLTPTTYNVGLRIFYKDGILKDVSDSLYTFNTITLLYEHIDKYVLLRYLPSDSLYLSFYYQPQGLAGNDPENTDSLVLEFNIPGNINWNHIWSVNGSANKAFKQVLIPIKDTIYYNNGFRFRFKNYASIGISYPPTEASFAGNADIWNIDYVSLAKDRNQNDTIPDDVAFAENVHSFLKDYVSVPWNHYKSTTGFQSDSTIIHYRNLNDTIKIVSRHYKITNKTTGSIILNDSLGSENVDPFTDFYLTIQDTANFFPQTTDDAANFEVMISQTHSTLALHEPYRWNDTIKFYQKFASYYAYDDGTPEFGLGLAGQNTENSQLAFKFYTLKPDTLRGVYMFFNRTMNDANQKYFYLTIWSALNGKPNSIIHKQEGVRPEFHGFNEFHYYSLDTTIFITDTFFIGWTQTDDVLLNIGFDVNYDASSKVFYKMTSFSPWINIPYQGTPMMRPVLSTQPFVGVNEPKITNEIKIYPNPASDIINIEAPEDFKFQLFNITGNLVLETNYDNSILNVSDLQPGIYLLRGTNGTSYITHKIIINR